jgi:predicted DNA-binding transcriptional regulator AlpA
MERPSFGPNPGRLLSAKDVAFHLNASTRTVWRWCEQGLLEQPIRLGKRMTRWHPEAVRAFVERASAAEGTVAPG